MLKKEIVCTISNITHILTDIIKSIELKTINLELELKDLKCIKTTLDNIEIEYKKENKTIFPTINKILYDTDSLYRKVCLEEFIIRNFKYGLNYEEQLSSIRNYLGINTTKGFIYQTIQNFMTDQTRYDYLLEYIQERQSQNIENAYEYIEDQEEDDYDD